MKGAINGSRVTGTLEVVSIHAPVKGAIPGTVRSSRLDWCFNPRTREGCDVIGEQLVVQVEVSIHAPVKGAMEDGAEAVIPLEFQSTHP